MADCQLRQWCGDSRLDVAKSPSFVLNDLERISESHFPDEFEKTDIYHHRTTKTAAESDDTLLNKLTMTNHVPSNNRSIRGKQRGAILVGSLVVFTGISHLG